MICDVKPDLNDIADRKLVPDHGRAEDRFAKGWHTNEHIGALAGTDGGESQ